MDGKATTGVSHDAGLRYMSRRRALAVTFMLAALTNALVFAFLGDTPFVFARTTPGRSERAALAIRDREHPFVQWGSRLFTERYLSKYYAEYWYITETRRGAGKEAFTKALKHALDAYPNVDLYLLAHTNEYIDWVRSFPESSRRRVRFVYNTGCFNEPQGPDWLALGAESYIGHPGQSESPYFYVFLLRYWTRGATLAEALEIGNRRMERIFRQLEFASPKRFNAKALMHESVASCVGNGTLRLEDMQ